jgi:hypothetical protein
MEWNPSPAEQKRGCGRAQKSAEALGPGGPPLRYGVVWAEGRGVCVVKKSAVRAGSDLDIEGECAGSVPAPGGDSKYTFSADAASACSGGRRRERGQETEHLSYRHGRSWVVGGKGRGEGGALAAETRTNQRFDFGRRRKGLGQWHKAPTKSRRGASGRRNCRLAGMDRRQKARLGPTHPAMPGHGSARQERTAFWHLE